MLMFTESIHKVVFFFRITTTIKKEKRGKYILFLFSIQIYLFFWGVVKMNNCIEFHFQDLSTAVAIATTCSTSSVFVSLYSKGNRSLLIRVIASTKQIIMGQKSIMQMVCTILSLFIFLVLMCGSRERF